MIVGECPYCDEVIIKGYDAPNGAWLQDTCESCDKKYWVHYSIVDPLRLTLEMFNDDYDIVNGKIIEKVKE